MPTDLKISQFADGGPAQSTDEIATNRGGVNTKVYVGSAAAADVGTGPDDVPINSDLGGAAYLGAGSNVGDLVQLEDVGGSPGLPAVDGSQLEGVTTESIAGLIEPGTNVTLGGSGTSIDPYVINSTSSVATTAADVTYTPSSGLVGNNVQVALTNVWDKARTALQPADVVVKTQFVSADQTITSAGTLTIAHGLSSIPKFVLGFLKCVTAEVGYVNGDITPMIGDNASNRGASLTWDATNIYIRYGSNTSAFSLINKTTGSGTNVTNGNFRFIVKAYA